MSCRGLDGVGRARRGEPARRGTALERPLIAVMTRAISRRTDAHEALRRSNASSPRDRCAAAGCAPSRYSPGGNDERSARQRPQPAAHTVAHDGRSDGATERKGHPRWRCDGIEDERAPEHSGPGSPALQARRANALRSRMRQIKPTGCGGPWRGGPSARPARRGCSSGGGSRASWHGDGCSVGRCASRNPPRLRTRW